MKAYMKKMTAILLAVLLMLGSSVNAFATEPSWEAPTQENETPFGVADGSLGLSCKSAILMEARTGTVLYQQNVHSALPPASVTKIMTLLLVMEALEAGTVRIDGKVTASANAASMGGSQIYLKEGEQMTVEDLLKSVVIASANDAAVALAEYLCGSVSAFVEKMNAKAKQLGMQDTVFENVTGLDDTAQNHVTSAHDIALMSQALIKHKEILQYSSVWMDTIRDGAFGLTNTNRLVRFYDGCTGLKTGSTSKAGFCVSVTAEREGLSLICVIMGAETRDVRNAAATALLDWGFASYGIYQKESMDLQPLPLKGGNAECCPILEEDFVCVLPKEQLTRVEVIQELPEFVTAPIQKGDAVGKISFCVDGKEIGSVSVLAQESVPRINFFQIIGRVLAGALLI